MDAHQDAMQASSQPPKRFAGARALVTGAEGGMGRALVAALRAEGAAVFGVDRAHGDLMDPAYADALPAQSHAALGGLDLVFNNAGLIARGPLTESSDADLALTLGVNVEAPARICRAAIPLMASGGGGAIVNTASCWGLRPGPNHALYCMSKAALAALTQCLGRDHAHEGVRVNAVAPNEVDTPMLRTGFERRGLDPETALAALGRSVPIGHVASPAEIVEAMLFLASDAARYITGTILEINGGKAVG